MLKFYFDEVITLSRLLVMSLRFCFPLTSERNFDATQKETGDKAGKDDAQKKDDKTAGNCIRKTCRGLELSVKLQTHALAM